MSDHDQRRFLDRLERGGRLQRIHVPVDPELESKSPCVRALREGRPVLLIEQPLARRIVLGAWSYLRRFTCTKFVIITDEDIELRDWSQVLANAAGKPAAR